MEEFVFRAGEFGALGLVTLYLLTKGTDALKELANSNKSLAEAVTKLADKVNAHDSRFNVIESQLREVKDLTAPNKPLVESVKTLIDKINAHDNRFNVAEQQLRSIENQLTDLCRCLADRKGERHENIH